MNRKFVFLPFVYSKEIVDNINLYFDKGYEIEDVFDADNGYYLLIVLDKKENGAYKHVGNFGLDNKPSLIEDAYDTTCEWVKTSTNDNLIN